MLWKAPGAAHVPRPRTEADQALHAAPGSMDALAMLSDEVRRASRRTLSRVRRLLSYVPATALTVLLVPLLLQVAPAAATTYPVTYSPFGVSPEIFNDPTIPPAGANNWNCRPTTAHPDPVVLVHGLGATMAENWATMSPLLADNGYCVFALTYGELPGEDRFGGFEPMEQSSLELAAFVAKVRAATGAAKVDLVGHSEGTVMPQYYLKFEGGAASVAKYVAISPLYHGTTLFGIATLLEGLAADDPAAGSPLTSGFASYCGSCQEFVSGSPFLRHLYADGVYAVPGVQYTAIMTRYDEAVTPYTSGELHAPNAIDIVVQDQCPTDFSEHVTMAWDPVVAQDVLNALDPAHPRTVPCTLVLPLLGAPWFK